jgi:hypothetical protein
MPTPLPLIVGPLVLGGVVLLGLAGYLIEKASEAEEHAEKRTEPVEVTTRK